MPSTDVPLRIILIDHQHAVRPCLESAVAWMNDCGQSPEVTAMTELALAEALNNIVEHAYPADEVGVIELCLEPLPDGVRCDLHDQGKEMPGGVLPAGQLPHTDVERDDLPEGGFGWHILLSVTDCLNYSRQDGTNRLTFTLRQEIEVSSAEPTADSAHR